MVDELASIEKEVDQQLRLWNLLYPAKPLQIGQKVKVSETNEFASEWDEVYVITGICLNHHKKLDITIADDLADGGCDGWTFNDLIPV